MHGTPTCSDGGASFGRGDTGHPRAMMFEAGSFRDRSARVFIRPDGVFRALSAEALADWKQVSARSFFQRLMSEGRIVDSRELGADESAKLDVVDTPAAVLQHERIPFVSYPYEWCFSMLRQAALLHLEILTDAVRDGFILKDASPYNVQFRGTQPTFIDLASFVPLTPGEPWTAYRQFCEMMLFPLLLQAYRNIDIQPTLRVRLEGISAWNFLRPLSWRDMFRPGVFTHGWLQSKLTQQTEAVQSSTVRDLQSSGFSAQMIQNNLAGLTRLVQRINWTPHTTQWTNYRHAPPHVLRDADAKADFVHVVCQIRRRRLVWDLGCNDGHFSRIAGKHADTVVAMDQDHGCVERLYRELSQERCSNIVPLCIDLLNPSPALGWRGRERSCLEDRGRPDLVLCLGLIHHLVIGGNIPLPEVVDWLASLGAEIVLEFPNKQDAMVQSLLRNKPDQYDDYSLPALQSSLEPFFQIRNRIELPSGNRTLLHLVPGELHNGAV
jgi:hypothetical protein